MNLLVHTGLILIYSRGTDLEGVAITEDWARSLISNDQQHPSCMNFWQQRAVGEGRQDENVFHMPITKPKTCRISILSDNHTKRLKVAGDNGIIKFRSLHGKCHLQS